MGLNNLLKKHGSEKNNNRNNYITETSMPISSCSSNQIKQDITDAVSDSEESELLKHIVSTSSKTFKITEFENAFFVAFEKGIKNNHLSDLEYSIERKGNGCIRICTLNGCQMCDIHLRKRIGSILYFTGDGIADKDIHNMSDAPYESVIAVIPYVIRYIKQSRERLKEIFS